MMAQHWVLQKNLSEFLAKAGLLTFTEIELPGTEGDNQRGYAGRADVVAIQPHRYAQKDIRLYEVKASLRDFQVDIAAMKWKRYAAVCHRFYFAMPAGLVKKADVPAEAGLIVYSEDHDSWHVTKGCRVGGAEGFSLHTALALLYRGVEEHRAYRDLNLALAFKEGGVVELVRGKGAELARRLARDEAKTTTQRTELEPELAELLEAMRGVIGTETLPAYKIRSVTEELRHVLRTIEEFKDRQKALKAIGGYLNNVAKPWSEDAISESRERMLQAMLPLEGAAAP